MAKSVKYTPDYKGTQEFGREPFVGALAVDAGRVVAAWAKANDPGGEYDVQEAGVPAGRHNQTRAGAVVTETVRDVGHFKRTLARAAQEARANYGPS